jgi:TrmH family RNA methyltransferase
MSGVQRGAAPAGGRAPRSIASADNPLYRSWLRSVQQPRLARPGAIALAEGLHLAQAALDAGAMVSHVLLREGGRASEADLLAARFGAGVVRVLLAPGLFDRLAPLDRAGSGIMLVLLIPPLPEPAAAAASGDLVLLDGIQDPGNAGTLLRTAAAAGVKEVWTSPGTVHLWTPKVLRAGMGAHFRLCLREGLLPDEGLLAGRRWLSAVAHGGQELWQADLGRQAVGWVLGGEGAGPGAAWLQACSGQLRIPIAGGTESLNVAAAAAICLFEMCRQRAQGGGRS